jgi:hypothetical protein
VARQNQRLQVRYGARAKAQVNDPIDDVGGSKELDTELKLAFFTQPYLKSLIDILQKKLDYRGGISYVFVYSMMEKMPTRCKHNCRP